MRYEIIAGFVNSEKALSIEVGDKDIVARLHKFPFEYSGPGEVFTFAGRAREFDYDGKTIHQPNDSDLTFVLEGTNGKWQYVASNHPNLIYVDRRNGEANLHVVPPQDIIHSDWKEITEQGWRILRKSIVVSPEIGQIFEERRAA